MQVLDDRYRLHELILKPSHGEVYVCYDLRDFTTKSFWIMPPARSSYATSFFSICNIVQSISSKELPKMYSSGIDPTTGKIYVVFEHFQAKNLQYVFENNQKISYKDAVDILIQLVRVVKYAENYVIHGRINPKNILVKDNHIQLLGFGLNYLQKVSGLEEEMKIYLPPEHLSGKIGDTLSDLYSIGVVFFRLLFGYATNEHSDMVAKIEEYNPNADPSFYSPYPWHLVKDLALKIISVSPTDRQIPNDSDSYRWVSAVEI